MLQCWCVLCPDVHETRAHNNISPASMRHVPTTTFLQPMSTRHMPQEHSSSRCPRDACPSIISQTDVHEKYATATCLQSRHVHATTTFPQPMSTKHVPRQHFSCRCSRATCHSTASLANVYAMCHNNVSIDVHETRPQPHILRRRRPMPTRRATLASTPTTVWGIQGEGGDTNRRCVLLAAAFVWKCEIDDREGNGTTISWIRNKIHH